MKINKPIVIALTAIAALGAASTSLSAQNTMSPYSRFGYGLLDNNATSAQRQMGSVGYAMNSGRQINVMNPASYAAIDSLTFLFDMGIDFTTLKSSENGVKEKQYGGGLDYITMQFPLGKWGGASIGLLPFSSVGYAFGSELDHGRSSRQGSGGINQTYLGLSARPFKGFSVGFNLSYLFGSTVNDVYVTTETSSTSLFEQEIDVRDWRFQAGVQYSVDLDSRNRVTLGVVYSPGKTLLGHSTVIKYDVQADEQPDTMAHNRLKNNYSLPETWGAGINWHWDNRLMVEADFTYQPWSKAKFLKVDNFIATQFADRWQVGLGVAYTHSDRASYLKRITYRAGAFYNHDYMKVADNNVREYGISCGFGLPAPSGKTRINLGFEYRHRQAHPNPLLKENYFNVTLGVNFNELWFFKNRLR